MDAKGFPEVGDEFEQVKGYPGVSEHIVLGSVFKVIKSQPDVKLVMFDKCNCPARKGTDRGCEWGWETYQVIYKYIEKFTQEEVDKAHSLPDPEDVASFMVTNGHERIA